MTNPTQVLWLLEAPWASGVLELHLGADTSLQFLFFAIFGVAGVRMQMMAQQSLGCSAWGAGRTLPGLAQQRTRRLSN